MIQNFKQFLLEQLVLNEQVSVTANQIASLASDLLIGKSASDIRAIFTYDASRGYRVSGNNKVIIDKFAQKGIKCFIDNSSNVMQGKLIKLEKPVDVNSRYGKPVEYRPSEVTRLVAITEQCPYMITLTYQLDKMGLDDQQFWDKIHKENVKFTHRVVDVKVEKITYQQLKQVRSWEYYRDLYRTFDWVPESDKNRWANIDKQDDSMSKASEREGSAKFTFGT